MVDNTREGEIALIDIMGFDMFLAEIHCIGGTDLPLKMYAIWCAEQTLFLSKAKQNREYLNLTKKFVRNGGDLKRQKEVVKMAQIRWTSLWVQNRTSVETGVAEAVLSACTAGLSSIHDAVRWGNYNHAIWLSATYAAIVIARNSKEGYELAWMKIREAQKEELRKICT